MKKFEICKATDLVLKDLQEGLHAAMDALITNKDSSDAERILRMVDDRMTALLNQSEVR